MTKQTVIIRDIGTQDYLSTWQQMRQFTDQRQSSTHDEIWLLEHPPVFTQGQAGKAEHVLNPGNIPVVQSDRGGQVTYHGPGQLVAYTLIDISRRKLSIRQLVTILETSVIALLYEHGIHAKARCDAPGVYVNDAKICSIGLRVRHGRAYHGLALNVAMDLTPFNRINPCGFAGLSMTQISDHTDNWTEVDIKKKLIEYLQEKLGYTAPNVMPAKAGIQEKNY